MFNCASCGTRVEPEDTSGTSGLYHPGPRTFLLCEDCFLEEDTMIDETGTNNHPDRLQRYAERQPQNFNGLPPTW